MNPTDQARKEARKKELKKNKKQRQMVRAAVLKGKDPNQLISEMEKIDRMEFDVNQPPVLNEKVLKDKRKKLQETFHRVMRLYEKEDPVQWVDLKRIEMDYDRRRAQLIQYFESVKHAQQVQIDDIPLPAMPSMEFSLIPLPSEIPLPAPPVAMAQPQSILKKPVLYGTRTLLIRSKAPGVPPGPPPPLSDNEDDDEAAEAEKMEVDKEDLDTSADTEENKKQRKIRFADDGASEDSEKDTRVKFIAPRIVSTVSANVIAGQELADFLKEVEESQMQESAEKESQQDDALKDISAPGTSGASLPPGPPPGMIFRPHMRHGMPPPPRLPPGPPPGRPAGPPGPPPGLPPRLSGPPLRMPPGPPPGMPPPRLIRPQSLQMSNMPPPPPSGSNPNVLSAPPSLISRPQKQQDDEKKTSATIEAKPQIRNLSTEVTRFMPTSLRVKREDKFRKRDIPKPPGMKNDPMLHHMPPKVIPSMVPTKDDAYDQFMKEMEGLL